MFDYSFTWGPHVDMIVSKTKQRLAQLCHLSLEPEGISIMKNHLSGHVWSIPIFFILVLLKVT